MLGRLLAGCAVLVVVVVLAGCSSGGQQPSDTLPEATATSTSTVTTPAASPLPPLGPPDLPMPDAARTQDAAGVEAFVRYYLDLINRTSKIMDAAPLRSFSSGCEECDRLAINTERDAAAARTYRGGELIVISAAPPTTDMLTGEMAFLLEQKELIVVNDKGHVIEDLGSPDIRGLSSGAAVEWDAGRHTWKMTQLTVG